MSHDVPTFCRICEAACGMVAEVDGERVLRLRSDPKHVVSRGYACAKGLQFAAVHHSTDRVTRPLKRVGGRFEPISWKQAFDEIGPKLRALLDEHGPQSFGVYAGNPVMFNFPHALFVSGLCRAVGTTNLFTAGSQDCNNKFHVARHMYGNPLLQPVPDLERVECLVIIGSNPAVSHMSFMHAPRAVERLRAIEKRGGRVVFVNPRRTESAKQLGQQLFIRPGTDVFFMLSFAHELLAQGGEAAWVRDHLENVDTFREIVAPWPADRTAEVTGIPVDVLRELVSAFRAAKGAALYASTGLNQGQEGTLAFWILSAINILSGNLDRRGGLLVQKGPAYVMHRTGASMLESTSRVGKFASVMETMPAGILADEIFTEGPGQIRGMLVTAGNPVMSCPNSQRMEAALSKLELLISVDLFRNKTGNLAHYVLPVPSFLEREDLPTSLNGQQPIPYVQFTESVVPRVGEVQEEWWIFTRLAEAAGLRMFGPAHGYLNWSTRDQPSVLAPLRFTSRKLLSLMLAIRGLRPRRLAHDHPSGKLLGEPKSNAFLGHWVPRPSGKVDMAPRSFVESTTRLPQVLEELTPKPDTLRLIGRRDRHTHNSWLHNVERLVSKPRDRNQIHLHPQDAGRLGLADGDLATVQSSAGAIELDVKLTDDLMPGVVAIPHGWGHQDADGLSVARQTSGANVNLLTPDGPDSLEPLSGMSRLTGIAVQVSRATPRAPESANGPALHQGARAT